MEYMRPLINTGDLVMRHKKYKDKTVFRVTDFKADLVEKRKLGLRKANSGEGFVDVSVIDRLGNQFVFKRRDLWRLPNQPRYNGTLSPTAIRRMRQQWGGSGS